MRGGRVLFLAVYSLLMVASVVLIAAACGGDATTTTGPASTAAPTTTAGSSVDGAALYAENCASCHLEVPEATVEAAKAVIENGTESMPGFAGLLSPEHITAIADYVGAGRN